MWKQCIIRSDELVWNYFCLSSCLPLIFPTHFFEFGCGNPFFLADHFVCYKQCNYESRWEFDRGSQWTSAVCLNEQWATSNVHVGQPKFERVMPTVFTLSNPYWSGFFFQITLMTLIITAFFKLVHVKIYFQHTP